MVIPHRLVQEKNIPIWEKVEEAADAVKKTNAHPDCTCITRRECQPVALIKTIQNSCHFYFATCDHVAKSLKLLRY